MHAANKIDNNDKKILHLLRQEKPCKILMVIFCQRAFDSLTKEQIKNIANPSIWSKRKLDIYRIKLDPTTINYHLNKLIKAGIVKRIRDGRKIYYSIADEEKLINFLIRYKDTLNNFYINDLLSLYHSEYYNNFFDYQIDKFVNRVKEVFPPPFYI